MINNPKITYVKNIFHPERFTETLLSLALEEIKCGKYQAQIFQLRELETEKEQKIFKKKLPAYAFNGIFENRVNNNGFLKSSGICIIDLDFKEQFYIDNIHLQKNIISNLPYILFCFISPRGNGLKIGVRINPDDVQNDFNFKKLFSHLAVFFKQQNYDVDKTGKDVRRLTFVSHDRDLYKNFSCETFDTKDYIVIDKCYQILIKSERGTKHDARLRAGKLAGGYIAGGQVDEKRITDILVRTSHIISEEGITSKTEMDTLLESIEYGKTIPIEDDFENLRNIGWKEKLKSHIDEMNTRYAKIIVGGELRILEKPGKESNKYIFHKEKSLTGLYSHKIIQIGEKTTYKKPTPVFADIITAWTTNKNCKIYSGGIEFAPNKDLGENIFNTWTGFAIEPVTGGCWDLFKYHIEHILCNDDKELSEYFFNWVAFTLQNPGHPSGVTLVVRGGMRAGKGVIGHFLKDLWGQHANYISNPAHLVGNFNAHLSDTCFLFADEAFYAGDKKHEGVLKAIITEPTLMIERKGIDAYQQNNCLNLYMATNSKYAVPASIDVNRYCVFDISNEKANKPEYFDPLLLELKDLENRQTFLYDMLNRNIDDFAPQHIPETAGLKEQREFSFNTMEEWLYAFLDSEDSENSDWKPVVSTADLHVEFIDWCNQMKKGTWERVGKKKLSHYLGRIFTHYQQGTQRTRSIRFPDTRELAVGVFETHHKI